MFYFQELESGVLTQMKMRLEEQRIYD